MDCIASALPNSNKQDPKYSTLTKTGGGSLVLNTALDEGDLTYVQMPISLRISGYEADAAG